MGTAEFGVPTLKALAANHDVPAVVTGVDSKKGRGRKAIWPPVKTAAVDLGLAVLQPPDLRDPEFIERLKSYDAELFFVVAFRILPQEVFTIPPRGTVNLHASLLPDYRGAAPINWAVINGDEVTGLTTFFINERVDTGDIIRREETLVGPDETAGELSHRMRKQGAMLALSTVTAIEREAVIPVSQPPTGHRPAPKLYKKDGLIDWSRDARTLHNMIRGMNPFPGAYTGTARGPVKIHRTALAEVESSGSPGDIVEASGKTGFTVSCGRGSLRIWEIQPPGKKSMDGASFVRGYRVADGMNIQEV